MKSFHDLAKDLSRPGQDILTELSGDDCHLLHMSIGISGEAGELLDAVKKYAIYRKGLDKENIIEELGDLRFFMAGLMNALNITEYDIIEYNNAKLARRYASGNYTQVEAINRADKNITQ